jgi:hypothetical protein
MTKLGLIALFSIFSVSAAQAVLPPYWERVREMEDILNNGSISNIIQKGKPSSSGVVNSLEFRGYSPDGAAYKVISGKCSLNVNVIYQHTSSPILGPAQYELSWDDQMTCTD